MPFTASHRITAILNSPREACPTTTEPSPETPLATLTACSLLGTAPGNGFKILQFFPPCQRAAGKFPLESETVPTIVFPSREMATLRKILPGSAITSTPPEAVQRQAGGTAPPFFSGPATT